MVLAVTIMAVWASNIAAARLAAGEIPGWALITIRMAVIAITLVPFVAIPRGHMWKIFGLSVTMGTMHFGLMFVALEHIHAGTAALILQTSVPFALLLALIFFERFLQLIILSIVAYDHFLLCILLHHKVVQFYQKEDYLCPLQYNVFQKNLFDRLFLLPSYYYS